MKNNSICPKCSSDQIYTDAKKSKAGDRAIIPVSSWSKLFVDVYVCIDCGYFEEYISTEDLKDPSKMNKLKENWNKI